MKNTKKLENLRQWIKENDIYGMQAFNTRNTVGDWMETVYQQDGVTVDYCNEYRYIEIFGLTDEEYQSLSDVLMIC